jgi:hypothetical protein
MKIAPIIDKLKKGQLKKDELKKDELKKLPAIEPCLVHSGQQYDELLSGNFLMVAILREHFERAGLA